MASLPEIIRAELGISEPLVENLLIDPWLNVLEVTIIDQGAGDAYKLLFRDVVESRVYRDPITKRRALLWSPNDAYQTEELMDIGEIQLAQLETNVTGFNDPAHAAGSLAVDQTDSTIRLTWIATWRCYVEFFHRGHVEYWRLSKEELIEDRRAQYQRLHVDRIKREAM